MKENYTHITVILDRSGSMEGIRDDVIGGFNAFLAEQQAAEGMATMTLVQFDTQNPYEVIANFQLLGTISPLTRELYVPRASTPLLDAVGRGINDLDANLNKMAAAERPEKVIFLIITDGQENSSHEFNRAQITQMISTHEEKDKWQFVFISADLAAMQDAASYGMRADNMMAFDKTSAGTANAFQSVSKSSRRYRERSASPASLAFDDEDRAKQDAEKLRNQ
jgi:hypothetical protein